MDLEAKTIEKEIFTGSDTCGYHSLWAKGETLYLFKKEKTSIQLFDNDLNPKKVLGLDSRVRHIVWEKENTFIIVCEKDVYRFNNHGELTKPFDLKDFKEISSGIVVQNQYLLLDVKMSDDNHQLRLFKDDKLVQEVNYDLKATM